MNNVENSARLIRKEKADRLIVTICEISDRADYFLHDWIGLNQHLKNTRPALLLFPDLIFFEWTGVGIPLNEKELTLGLENQASWITQLANLDADYSIYSRLMMEGTRFFKAIFIYDKKDGHQMVRKIELVKRNDQVYLPKVQHSAVDCEVINIQGYNIGIVLDTELWTTAIANQLVKSEIDILLCPRASSKDSVEQWIRLGQTMAVLSGAFCLSSNKTRLSKNNFHWGGRAFVAEPFTGKLLGSTNNHKRFLTLELDMKKPREAKSKFPLKSAISSF